MTLGKLIKTLQKLEKQCGPRATVVVNKESLFDGNRSWELCNVSKATYQIVPIADDDGFQKYTKRGLEVQSRCIVLEG